MIDAEFLHNALGLHITQAANAPIPAFPDPIAKSRHEDIHPPSNAAAAATRPFPQSSIRLAFPAYTIKLSMQVAKLSSLWNPLVQWCFVVLRGAACLKLASWASGVEGAALDLPTVQCANAAG